jgi:hypothetical protein
MGVESFSQFRENLSDAGEPRSEPYALSLRIKTKEPRSGRGDGGPQASADTSTRLSVAPAQVELTMPTVVTPCPICEAPAVEALPRHGDVSVISCYSCGAFKVSGTHVHRQNDLLEPAGRAILAPPLL